MRRVIPSRDPAGRPSSREVVDYLRGLTILVIIASHFLYHYDLDFYKLRGSVYGNASVAAFFILSGYVAFFSFRRRSGGGPLTARQAFRYYFDRARRIYPLYWLALVIAMVLQPDFFATVAPHGLRSMIPVFLAFPLKITVFWFVVSIGQCYLVAPLIYMVCQRVGFRVFLALGLVALAVSMALSCSNSAIVDVEQTLRLGPSDTDLFMFQSILLANFLLFSLGMALPGLVDAVQSRMRSAGWVLASVAVLGALMFWLHRDVARIHADVPLSATAFFAGVYFFCLTMLAVRPRLPLLGAIGFSGSHSYSLYLFQEFYFIAITAAAILKPGQPLTIVLTVALLPLLFAACYLLEDGPGWLQERLGLRLRATGTPEEEAAVGRTD